MGDLQYKLGESQEALKCWELAHTLGEGSLQLADKILKKSYVHSF
jgi:hypothetical protein